MSAAATVPTFVSAIHPECHSRAIPLRNALIAVSEWVEDHFLEALRADCCYTQTTLTRLRGKGGEDIQNYWRTHGVWFDAFLERLNTHYGPYRLTIDISDEEDEEACVLTISYNPEDLRVPLFDHDAAALCAIGAKCPEWVRPGALAAITKSDA